jgi:hypothetical protein
MATIRASCDTCGDVEFNATQVTVHAPDDGGGGGTYAFDCPLCHTRVVRSAERQTVDLLIAAGVNRARVPESAPEAPTGRLERRSEVSRPISYEDLDRFHRLLGDDDALQEAVAMLHDPDAR